MGFDKPHLGRRGRDLGAVQSRPSALLRHRRCRTTKASVVLLQEAVLPLGMAEIVPEPLVDETGAAVLESRGSSWIFFVRPASQSGPPGRRPCRPAARLPVRCAAIAREPLHHLSSVAGVNASATVCTRRLDRGTSACDTALLSPRTPATDRLMSRQYLRCGPARWSGLPILLGHAGSALRRPLAVPPGMPDRQLGATGDYQLSSFWLYGQVI